MHTQLMLSDTALSLNKYAARIAIALLRRFFLTQDVTVSTFILLLLSFTSLRCGCQKSQHILMCIIRYAKRYSLNESFFSHNALNVSRVKRGRTV